LLQLEQSLRKVIPIVLSCYHQQTLHWLSLKLAGFGMLLECFERRGLQQGRLKMYFCLHELKPVGRIGQL